LSSLPASLRSTTAPSSLLLSVSLKSTFQLFLPCLVGIQGSDFSSDPD